MFGAAYLGPNNMTKLRWPEILINGSQGLFPLARPVDTEFLGQA